MTLLRRTRCILVAGLAASAALGSAQTGYEVRLENATTTGALAILQTTAEREGIRVAEGGDILATFRYWPEAEYARRFYQERLGLPLVVRQTTATAAMTAGRVADVPKRVFALDVPSVDEAPDHRTDDNQGLLDSTEASLEGMEKTAAITYLSGKLSEQRPTDPVYGWLLTKRGIAYLQKGDYDAAMQDLRQVAEGRVAATKVDRVKAMRRVAWSLHAQRKHVDAFKAYDELEGFSRHDATRATARVEKCGIVMELARSAKGTLDDTQAAMREALNDIPVDQKRQRGTIALMDLECDYYSERFALAAEKAEQWLLQYDDQLRDTYMCLTVAGLAYHNMGDAVNGDRCLLAIQDLPEPTSDQDRFGSKGKVWDMKARALSWLTHYANQRGDAAKAEKYWLLLKQRKGPE